MVDLLTPSRQSLSLPSSGNGYIPAVFIYYPLPYRDPKNRYTKTVRDITLVMTSDIGCPYGKMGRSLLTLIATEAVTNRDPYIPLGRIADVFPRLGLQETGGKRGTIGLAANQLHRIANTHVDLRQPRHRGFEELHFDFTVRDAIYWAAISSSNEVNDPLLPPDTDLDTKKSYLNLSAEFFAYLMEHAVPILLEPYFAIRSPREQDVFAWVVRRLWNLPSERLVSWEDLYEQFGPIDRTNKPRFRNEVGTYLYNIKTNIYHEADIAITQEGVVLRPSPPLVDPTKNGRNGAGYLP